MARKIETVTVDGELLSERLLDPLPLDADGLGAQLDVVAGDALVQVNELSAALAEAQQQRDQVQAELDALKAQYAPVSEDGVPVAISALQGLLLLDAIGLSEAYQAWSTSPERTFAERAFIDKATTWRIDNPTLIAGAAALGLPVEALGQFFVQASQIKA